MKNGFFFYFSIKIAKLYIERANEYQQVTKPNDYNTRKRYKRSMDYAIASHSKMMRVGCLSPAMSTQHTERSVNLRLNINSAYYMCYILT